MAATHGRSGALFLTLVAATSGARAHDWPCARHDPQRTGAVEGPVRLPQPTVRWRHYLGGQLRDDQWLTGDVDGDHVVDVVFVASGKVICKHADDELVWESDLVAAQSLVAETDLDQDGHREVVVIADLGDAMVLDGRTGRVLWEVPQGLRGFTATVRLGDLDGDQHDDLYVGECVQSSVGAAAFTFRDGFAAVRQLWTVAADPNRCGDRNDLIVDLDGDGANEVLMAQGDTQMAVLDGRNGVRRWTVPAPPSGSFLQTSVPVVANVDRTPRPELVVLSSNARPGAAGVGARRIAVYDLPTAPSTTATLRWEAAASMPDGSTVTLPQGGVVDLDGDGTFELVSSRYDGMTRQWESTVRDAATGTVRATRAGYELLGVVPGPAAAGSRPTMVGVLDDQSAVAMTFAAGTLTDQWTLPQRRPAMTRDAAVAARSALSMRPFAMQLDDDASPELLLVAFDPTVAPEDRTVTELLGYDFDGTAPRQLGVLDATDGATMLTFQPADGLSRPYAQPVVVTSDGYLLSLDRALMSTNRLVGAEFTVPGMRVGGFWGGPTRSAPTPIIGSLPGATGSERAVLVRDSRPALLRLDARVASLASPAVVRWQRPRAAWPLITDLDGDGANDLAALDGRALVSIDPVQGQTPRWYVPEAAGPRGSYAADDLLPLHRAGETGADIVVMRVDPGATVHPSAFRGRDGMLRWNGFQRVFHSGFGSYGIMDSDGDGTDDVIAAVNAMLSIRGTDGMPGPDGYGVPYASPIIAPWTGSAPQVFAQASTHDGLLDASLHLQGQLSEVPFATSAGALVRCNGAPALVVNPQGSAELRVIRPQDLPLTGPSPASATVARAFLAGGQAYATAAMVPAASRAGTLSNATSVLDWDGRGRGAVLVGGTDGWLYALDACALTLLWSKDFRYPVGEPVVGDTDGDGTDDVLVIAGDGYLYALGARTLDAVTSVHDVDPRDAAATADLDEVETFDTVAAWWQPSASATHYQVRVMTESGTALQFPEYVDVATNRATVRSLPLRLGGHYRVGVVALSASGSSDEAQSNGFTVVDRSPPAIVVTANPQTIAPPAQTSNLEVDFSDLTGLATTHAELVDADGNVVRVLDDTSLRTVLPTRTVRYAFDGVAPDGRAYLAPGVYTIRAHATDVGGHSVDASGTVTLLAPTNGVGTRGGSGSGCTCDAPGAPAGSTQAWIALLAVLGLRPGRSRRRGVRLQ